LVLLVMLVVVWWCGGGGGGVVVVVAACLRFVSSLYKVLTKLWLVLDSTTSNPLMCDILLDCDAQ
jgi:hypothetical protein